MIKPLKLLIIKEINPNTSMILGYNAPINIANKYGPMEASIPEAPLSGRLNVFSKKVFKVKLKTLIEI